MGENETKTYPQTDNSLDQLLKKTRDDGENLEKFMEWAKQQVEADSLLEKPSIPETPKNEFAEILAKLESRGIKPRVTADLDEEEQKPYHSRTFSNMRMESEWQAERKLIEQKETSRRLLDSKKKYFFQPLKAVGVAAACFFVVVMVILLKPGIDVVGHKEYRYHSRVVDDKGVIWNNQDDYITDKSRLEKAYDEIKEKLGVAILKLNYIPENMKLSKVIIENGHAKLRFSYNNAYVYMIEVLYPVDNSDSRFSDREIYKVIKNNWLDKEIPVLKNKVSSEQYEYNAYLEIDNAYYYFEGVMEEDVFFEIIENLSL